jgi:hypothetical protein
MVFLVSVSCAKGRYSNTVSDDRTNACVREMMVARLAQVDYRSWRCSQFGISSSGYVWLEMWIEGLLLGFSIVLD